MKFKYIFLILLTLTLLSIIGCSNDSSSAIEDYLKCGGLIDSNAKDVMPSLDNLPKYENIEYKYTDKSSLLFTTKSVALIVKYDDNTYESEKNKLRQKYTFLKEKVESTYNEFRYLIPEHKFLINSYIFKVVAGNENDNTEFPKSFGMVGISEKKKSIAYLYFYDMDLDYIAEKNDKYSMANFVNDYFEYDF